MLRLDPRPPLISSSFRSLDPNRFDKIRLYIRRSNSNKFSSNGGVTQGDKSNSTSSEEHGYRYELRIVDRKISDEATALQICIPCAVLLIPAGRETEYLFNSKTGLLNVARSAKTARIIAVSFGRNLNAMNEIDDAQEQIDSDFFPRFDSLESVQAELTKIVQFIAQHGEFLRSNKACRNVPHFQRLIMEQKGDDLEDCNNSIPFLAVDGIGRRDVIARGETTTTGQFVVEDVAVENNVMRRLYFLNSPNVIQTEVYMKQQNDVDVRKLAFDYHKHIIFGFMILGSDGLRSDGDHTIARPNDAKFLPAPCKALIVGLGGGGLVNFLANLCFRGGIHMTIVEIDEGVVDIAKSHFGLETSENLNVVIGDGLDVTVDHSKSLDSATNSENCVSPGKAASRKAIAMEKESTDFIVLDVDSKDKTVGMSCPPMDFIQLEYLLRLKDILSCNFGVIAINVSARDPFMLKNVKENVQAAFSQCSLFVTTGYVEEKFESDEIEQETKVLNVVIFAVKSRISDVNATNPFRPIEEVLDKFDKSGVTDSDLRGELESFYVELKQLELSGFEENPISSTKAGQRSNKKSKRGRKQGKRK